jgi:hypothetical protein
MKREEIVTEQSVDQDRRRSIVRSVFAVLAGLVTIFVLSLATDQLFHSIGVYPPWGVPMLETGDNLIAFAYRAVYAVLGGYVAARLAPRAPVGHALALGAVGVVLATLGAIAAWEMSPAWFLIGLIAISLPAAWLGGIIRQRRLRDGASRSDLRME